MTLTGLSLYRVTGGVPPVPTNDERTRALRAALPAPRWNAHNWLHAQAEQYAREQSPIDPIPNYAARRGF